MRLRALLAPLVVIAAILVAAEPGFAQCSMCRSVVAQSAEGRALAEQLNVAILVLLAGPYLIVASVLGVVFRERLFRYLGRVLRLPAR